MNLGQSAWKTQKMQIHLIFLGLLFFCSLPLSHACREDLFVNVNFPGQDVTFHYSPDAEHCQKLCTQYPKCFFFTFYRASWTRDNKKFYCYLKFSESGEPSAQTPLNGVTSGFSLRDCDSEPEHCLTNVYNDVAFLGTDYKFLFTSSYEACQRVCTRDPSCQFFTFLQGDYATLKLRHKCHLKYSVPDSVPRIPAVDGLTGVISGFSNTTHANQNFTENCSPKTESGNMAGTDVESLPATSTEHCRALCSAHPCCTVFSYDSSSYTCNFKSNTEVAVNSSMSLESGLPVYECLLDTAWVTDQHDDVDFKGCGFRTVENTTDADACKDACDADRHCQFYTYIKDDFSDADQRKSCYLKRVVTMPVPLKVSALQNAVSGFSEDICV